MATKTEIERLSVVETKVDAIGSDVKDIKDTLVAEIKDINTKFDNLDNKYAAKWVQSAVAFVVGIIISAVLVALLALVIIKPTANNPTTSNTTTTNTPTGSTSQTSTKDGTPSASATSNATATPENPNATDTQTSNGGVDIDLPKVTP